MVIDILNRIGLKPNRLELELTESVLLHHPEQALATLNKLRGHGIKLSLDDFGTGYSSLSYLRRFPFTKLKIDRSFVQDLGDGKEAGVLARAIVAMGHSLGLEVTAEGVETEEQYRFLEAEDCNQVQGYLLGKPVPADQLGRMQRVGCTPRPISGNLAVSPRTGTAAVLKTFERYPLTFGPTPIEKLNRLSTHLGGNVEIYAKREDCNSGLAFGGNKLRKLEYIVPDAIASGADTLVSIGGVQSNHTRMVAAVAAKIGMKCRLVQEHWVPYEDAVYDRVGNIMLSRIMGADVRLIDAGFDIGIRQSWEEALEDVRASGGRPYAIPAGASVHKYGGLGYVGFAEEVRAQEQQLGIRFDYIVVCTVTGSTHAGMVVGFAADGRARRVIGIDASATPAQTKAQVLDIAQKTAALVKLEQDITADDVVLIEHYAYPVYGIPSEETKQAIRLAARTEGMITDPVYEGKSMQGMIDLIRKDYFPAGSKILYAHLGGAPALNGYSYAFRNG